MRKTMLAAMLAAMGLPGVAGAADVDLDKFLRRDAFTDIKLSPGGEYYAATVPLEKSTAVAILRVDDGQIVGRFVPPENNHARRFDWVSTDRVLIELGQKLGSLDEPRPTGELYSLRANTSSGELLVGYRVTGGHTGTRISGKKAEAVAAFLTDDLPDDDKHVLIAVSSFNSDPYTRLERMDVTSGRRIPVTRSPVQRAGFTTDREGQARFALGAGSDNVNKLYYRDRNNETWRLVNDEAVTFRIENAIGFSEDGTLAYLQVQQRKGPDKIVSWNPLTDERKDVLRDPLVDAARIIRRPGTAIPVGALYLGETPRTRFFDEASADARLYRSLESAFGGDAIFITSSTQDGNKVLVETFSASNPGDFFIYDQKAKAAQHVVSRSSWIDPAQSAQVRAITVEARDGVPLHGFLTSPHGQEAKNLPTVILPHGGPFNVFDDGTYDVEAQMLAAAGYAVLQLNFRGSGNYGRAFHQAGAQQWGLAMQDDLTDATRWAISEGIANKARICIYGASYGAYAALMGVAKEPGLYRCAAGYVGVYDLPMMHSRGDIQTVAWGETFLREWLGPADKVRNVSPVNLAANIKVPVFLAAGREDERAPVQHTERMEAALKKAGVPVESLYYPREGHGFYVDANRREYYGKLLAFLSQNLGGDKAAPPKPAAP
ncbi:alpha/beta hydrolase family protein [Stenotrophomonas tumulicola]|uniref:S9 family peptidase n=1 Tax=Stenotrophomonas tumulicola TaxID=1685415 RepID=A0A7W3FLI2_9GAMM|nr:prolyl oligopeptidase family serine peptidase [Stenotrophomonas tumulicola]MBA8681760.1 S9 family peptidase [Stenotrophomonas tumulicola]